MIFFVPLKKMIRLYKKLREKSEFCHLFHVKNDQIQNLALQSDEKARRLSGFFFWGRLKFWFFGVGNVLDGPWGFMW